MLLQVIYVIITTSFKQKRNASYLNILAVANDKTESFIASLTSTLSKNQF